MKLYFTSGKGSNLPANPVSDRPSLGSTSDSDGEESVGKRTAAENLSDTDDESEWPPNGSRVSHV